MNSERRFGVLLGSLVVILAAGTGSPAAAYGSAPGSSPSLTPPERPNIIFILTDDQRWDALGAAGNPIVKTPNLDRLAARGVLFTNSFGTTPVCYASRATLYTGQYNRRHGVDSFEEFLSPEAFAQTYPALLRQAGYYTGFIGKWGLGGELPEQEFDDWQGFAGQGSYFEPGIPEHLTRRQGHQAAEFVRTAREPFQLTLAFKAPHVQDGGCSCTMPPDVEDLHLYDDVAIPKPHTATDAAFAALPRFLRESEGRVRWFDQFGTPELDQKSRKDYYRLITGMDRAVGEMLAALEARGITSRTVIVFTSDNGLLLGEHGLTGKWLMYEESIRVPLFIVWPGVPAARQGAKSPKMALNVDIAPTILDAAGLPAPAGMQGRSLKPLVFGTPTTWRGDWFFEHHLVWNGIPMSEGVRRSRWKYVRYLSESPIYEQLFDLDLDPYEEQDVLHTPVVFDRRPWFYRKIVNSLRGRWQQLRTALE
jgi:arylsulfatase A-like enzyme